MGGGRANSVVGPTARRRLTQLFTTFMGHEEDFFRTLLGRLTQRLYPSDLVGLQSFGLAVQEDHDEQRGDSRGTFDDQESLSEEEKESRRNATLPLVHKALIYFGDLARYGELYRERGAGNGVVGAAQSGDRRGRGTKGRIDGESKGWNYARASECYNQARILCPDNGESPSCALYTSADDSVPREPIESTRSSVSIHARLPLCDVSLLPRPRRPISLPHRSYQHQHRVHQGYHGVVRSRGWRAGGRRGGQVQSRLWSPPWLVLHQDEVSIHILSIHILSIYVRF